MNNDRQTRQISSASGIPLPSSFRNEILKPIKHAYIERDQELVPNYGERYRNGERGADRFPGSFCKGKTAKNL
jgi:hypothetical protein